MRGRLIFARKRLMFARECSMFAREVSMFTRERLMFAQKHSMLARECSMRNVPCSGGATFRAIVHNHTSSHQLHSASNDLVPFEKFIASAEWVHDVHRKILYSSRFTKMYT